MLYQRWRQIVDERRRDWALRDLTADRTWTFAELEAAADACPLPEQAFAHPNGLGAEFVLTVLRAWRQQQVLCPLDPGQSPPAPGPVPSGCVHLKTTSASTGPARAIAFTAGQLCADAENIATTMGLRRDWPNVGTISLAHSYGFSNLVLPLLLHGIPLILAGSALPAAVQKAAGQAEEITLPSVPVLWRTWHEAGVIPPNVRLAISAGAPLPLSLETAIFAATGLKLHNFYGSSECGGIAYDRTDQPRADGSCVGTPMNGVEVARTGEGCLEVRSQAVALGYWPEPDSSLSQGRFQTCDLVEVQDGQIFLRGRAGDLINLSGRKISPDVIERALLEHELVRECLVFGAPDREASRSETMVACVASRHELTSQALRDYLLQKLPSWQVPRHWVLVKSLPVNERGKLSRAEWRARYVAGELG